MGAPASWLRRGSSDDGSLCDHDSIRPRKAVMNGWERLWPRAHARGRQQRRRTANEQAWQGQAKCRAGRVCGARRMWPSR